MAYILVILRGGPNVDADHIHAEAHEQFITSLIRNNVILLGGGFAEPVGDVYAAYVLRCGDVGEAQAIAARDPLVMNDVLRPECVEWSLVGINTDAIDATAVVRPGDV